MDILPLDGRSVTTILLTFITTLFTSSGFWIWVVKRLDSRDLRTRLLIGLAHDRIISLALTYIDRGWIDRDEYENLKDYLYAPYIALGGNGTAAKILDDVERLPIRKHIHKKLPKRKKSTKPHRIKIEGPSDLLD